MKKKECDDCCIPPPSSSPSQTKHMINIQTERGIHMFGARKERERRTYGRFIIFLMIRIRLTQNLITLFHFFQYSN